MTNKFLGIVSEQGWKDSQKIIERIQAKYGKDVTVAELLDKMNKEVLVLN